ncbi:MAG TPA: YhjD/YihY/BrkB family envelope integrity protein [Steroidobacteraceae bacterium]|nr:YhjD/YihY/BrkB family envelope integrity protein [Steroidobacteraceae bacterium]
MAATPLLRSLHLRFEYWLFDLPEEVVGRAARLALGPLRYLYALVRDFIRGDLGLRAMGLVYSSLFALVPVIAVSFSVLTAFGYHRELEPVLFEFLRPLGVKGYELTASIMQFVENAQTTVLGTVGFVFLIYTVIMMIRKIEDALNFTWHVERPRSLARRVSEYLVIMLTGPVVAVGALVLLTRVEASDVMGRLSGLAGGAPAEGQSHFAPYLMIIALFWFMYFYMPNTRVKWQAALIGALFGGTVWVTVGAIFARVAVYATQTAAVYAGFAIVLLFLVWLHLSWLIMLLGGQLSFYWQHPEHLRTGHGQIPTTAILRERIAMGAMYLIAERFLEGSERWKVSDLADRMDVPASVLDSALCNLEDRGLVLTAEDDTVAPARDLATITLADILDAVRHETPDPRRPEPQGVAVADAAALAADAAMRESMSRKTLRDLVGSDRTAP